VPIRTHFAFLTAAIAVLVVAFVQPRASFAAQNADRDRSGAPPTSANAPPPAARVDINHASVEELLKVPGMTSSWAGRIVRFRPYRTKQDLLDRGVLSSSVYDRIKDYVIAHRDPH
jgi:DNA uptake protein ComE-like DNA-binding protein